MRLDASTLPAGPSRIRWILAGLAFVVCSLMTPEVCAQWGPQFAVRASSGPESPSLGAPHRGGDRTIDLQHVGPWRPGLRPTFCEDESTRSTFDTAGLGALYCAEAPVLTYTLDVAHASSYPVFYGAVPAAWVGAWLLRDSGDFRDAYRLTLTQGVTFATVVGLKRWIGRPRPYVTLPGVESRSTKYGKEIQDGRFASMPSGHASLATALAVSWSLSHPEWYVIAPAGLWAGSVSLSRLYLGVHYPSDVVLGTLLGAGVATVVHVMRDALTPDDLLTEDPVAAIESAPTLQLLRIRL